MNPVQTIRRARSRPAGTPNETGKVAAATAALLREIMAEAKISRLVVAGGDTSTLAIRSLDIWGLSYRAPCVPGAPLCRSHSDDPQLDGLDIILKGGQMGPIDFFAKVAAESHAGFGTISRHPGQAASAAQLRDPS